jgi:hypothetical protein
MPDPDDDEPEPETITDNLIFVPSAGIRRLYTCDLCGEKYIDVSSLGRHIATDHAPAV